MAHFVYFCWQYNQFSEESGKDLRERHSRDHFKSGGEIQETSGSGGSSSSSMQIEMWQNKSLFAVQCSVFEADWVCHRNKLCFFVCPIVHKYKYKKPTTQCRYLHRLNPTFNYLSITKTLIQFFSLLSRVEKSIYLSSIPSRIRN